MRGWKRCDCVFLSLKSHNATTTSLMSCTKGVELIAQQDSSDERKNGRSGDAGRVD